MDVFLTIFSNLIPLYILIGLGYVAGRFFEVERQSLGSLGIYIFMPIVAFGYVAGLDFKAEYLLLPVIVFFCFALMTLSALAIGRRIYPDNRANLAAMCAAAGNTGYFMLPVVLLLFDPEWVAVYIFAMMGVAVHEATIMYYVANRGHFDVRQSLYKLLKFPTIYTIIAALCFNFMQLDLPDTFTTYWEYTKGAYVLVGMMIIGVSLSKTKKLVIAPRFLSFVFIGKFLIWPLLSMGLIWLDKLYFKLWGDEIHYLFLLMAIAPPAANISAFAAQLDLHPEKAATTILLGTILALVYVPFMIAIFLT